MVFEVNRIYTSSRETPPTWRSDLLAYRLHISNHFRARALTYVVRLICAGIQGLLYCQEHDTSWRNRNISSQNHVTCVLLG